MNILLTIYDTPAWELLAHATGVTLADTLPLTNNEAQVLLRPVQKMTALVDIVLTDAAPHMLFLGVVQAEYYIAYAVENGSSIESAAARWQSKTYELLSIQRKNRKKIKLFNIHQALCKPKKFQEALNQAINLHNYLPHHDESSLEIIAACQYVNQMPEMKALNVQLQASVLALKDTELLTIDVDHVMSMQRIQATELGATHEEYDQLLKQTQQIQDVLEQTNARCEQLEIAQQQSEKELGESKSHQAAITDELREAETELKEAEEKLRTAETTLNATAEERDLILSQLHLVQEQLESYYLQLQSEQQQNRHTLIAHEKQSAKELEKLEVQLRQTKAKAASAEYNRSLLEQELHKMRSSIVWKSAAPIRAVRRIGKKADPAYEQLQQQIALLLTSEYFDVEWYLKHYPDVAECQMNPAEHYILYGAAEGRLPSLHFDGNWYLQQYPDIHAAGLNPLLHFIMFGQEEGRSSSPILLGNNSPEEE